MSASSPPDSAAPDGRHGAAPAIGKPETNTVLGLGFALLGAFSFQTMNAAVRHVSAELHTFEVAFFRSLFGVLALAPVFVRSGLAPLRTRRLGLHFVRGTFGLISLLTFFMALTLMPLAKVSAMFFSTPLFVTILAVLFLGERIRARRISALITGFVGMMIIVPPGPEALEPGALLVLASAMSSAAALLLSKILVRTDSPITITLYNGLIITPVTFVIALMYWTTPSLTQLLWLAGIGLVGTIGHVSVNRAFREADLSAIMPAEFTKLIWAALIGYFAFNETPELETWIGGGLIFSAVSYIAWRERTIRGTATPVPIAPGGPPPPGLPPARS